MADTEEWPAPDGETVVLLVETSGPVERQVVDRWVRSARPISTDVEVVSLREGVRSSALRRAGDPWLAPIRVAWLPAQHDGARTVRVRDVLRDLGDPRRPRMARQRQILRDHLDRCRVVVAQPARLSDLEKRYDGVSGDGPARFDEFVERQAMLALERAESRLVGAAYKVPRLVREEILASARFQSRLAELASELGRGVDDVATEAGGYLAEMVTGWSRLLVDLSVRLGRYNFRRGYDPELDLDEEQVGRLRDLAARHSLVFLPSHKSNLDSLVMNVALHDSGLPRTHVFGGINMAFWPVGPIFRHAGTIYIRRDTRGNRVYTFTLREYMAYLIEKRFSLQFYVEGGRSRTGKLLPPKLGLLAYIADAYRQGQTDDVVIVPVSIAYDQLQEVGEFAREARGGGKSSENLFWVVRAFREMRGRYGRIYVRFGEPVSLRDALGPPGQDSVDEDGDRLALQKVGLEVSRRINEVTPITATSLVTLTLLGAQGRALTVQQVRAAVHDSFAYAVKRDLPLTRDVDLDSEDGVVRALLELERHGVVSRFDAGPDPVYAIGQDQHLAAAFYRNTVIHFFLLGSIAQAGLAAAVDDEVEDTLATFWDTVMAVRDLLKFEFFFEPREQFRRSIRAEMDAQDLNWEARVAAGPDSVRRLLGELRPLTAHTVLRSFLESYGVVAAALVQHPAGEVERREFLSSCLALGRQYQLQQRIRSPESVARPLFANALKLAESRGLTGPSADVAGRRAFLDEVRDAIRELDIVELLATTRIVDLINAG